MLCFLNGLLVVSSLGIYCESLVFGVHFVPVGCNFCQFLTWYVGKFGHTSGDLVIIAGTVHHVVPWGRRCCLELNGLVLFNEAWVPTNVPNSVTHSASEHLIPSYTYSSIHLLKKKRLFLSLLYDTFFFLGPKRDVTSTGVSLTDLHSR